MTYGPAALGCFFFGMSLLEGKGIEGAKKEVEMKFLPSYKVCMDKVQTLHVFNAGRQWRLVSG